MDGLCRPGLSDLSRSHHQGLCTRSSRPTLDMWDGLSRCALSTLEDGTSVSPVLLPVCVDPLFSENQNELYGTHELSGMNTV